MIDLIIPYYNNQEGLNRTLASIDQSLFNITIVDDSSDHVPWCPNASRVLRYNQNRGPGFARQFGLDRTNLPYVMFLDTGDAFVSKEVQKKIVDIVTSDPEVEFWSFPYFHYGELTNEEDNRLHGKVYKRSFLEKYGITFPFLYLDEDIGFNRACRLCTTMRFVLLPVIDQIKEANSITQKDNGIYMYRDQTRALSYASLHTINICRRNNIEITEEINYIAVALYYWFIRTAAEHPEYLQESWTGAKIFYDIVQPDAHSNQLAQGNAYLKKCLQYRNKISFPINILRFVYEIQKYEIVPIRYLTLS